MPLEKGGVCYSSIAPVPLVDRVSVAQRHTGSSSQPIADFIVYSFASIIIVCHVEMSIFIQNHSAV